MPRTSQTLAAAFAALMIAAPAAPAMPAVDRVHTSSPAATTSSPGQDVRSPDVRDAAEAAIGGTPAQDLRSPDTRDGGAGVGVAQRTIRPVRVVDFGDNGFDWTDAAVGAGGALGLVLVLGAGGAAVVRRRVDHRPTAQS
jgi:hypothetical protein